MYTDLDHIDQVDHMYTDYVFQTRSYRSYCTSHLESIGHVDHTCHVYTVDRDHTGQVDHIIMYSDYPDHIDQIILSRCFRS